MRRAYVGLMALALAAVPTRTEAQSDWWDWTLNAVSVQVHVDLGRPAPRVYRTPDVVYREEARRAIPRRRSERYEDARGKHGKGPAFCRSGAGHPVHGRRWCVEKGFGLGDGRGHMVRWERTRWSDVSFGPRWYRGRAEYVDARHLSAVIGVRPYDRLDALRRRMGGRQALTGRWVRPRSGVLVLQVRSGPTPIAELSDLDRDGRVDVVMVARW